VLTVSEHIAVVQRAQAIAATDHGALVRVQRELAAAQVELKQLRRWARRRAPTISGCEASGGCAPRAVSASYVYRSRPAAIRAVIRRSRCGTLSSSLR
jgi:hypothetical protein